LSRSRQRALDAALAPITISVLNPEDVKSIYLAIDDNPAPLAAHITFVPAGDPQSLKFRVCVNKSQIEGEDSWLDEMRPIAGARATGLQSPGGAAVKDPTRARRRRLE
jgi:Sulfur oxidation protein SoxY